MRIELRRVYDPVESEDEFRVLVDRLWPRGITKERAQLGLWAKEIAPSAQLRMAWHSAPEDQWDQFADAYRAELAGDASTAVDAFIDSVSGREKITLLFGSRDSERNHANVLREELLRRIAGSSRLG